MVELRGFAEQATPVAVNLRKAAPGLTDATQLLRPFSRAATISLTNLGDNDRRQRRRPRRLLAGHPPAPQGRREVDPRRPQPQPAADDPAPDGRHRLPDEVHPQLVERLQRLRPVRPLPARAAADHQLRRVRRHARHRLRRDLVRRPHGHLGGTAPPERGAEADPIDPSDRRSPRRRQPTAGGSASAPGSSTTDSSDAGSRRRDHGRLRQGHQGPPQLPDGRAADAARPDTPQRGLPQPDRDRRARRADHDPRRLPRLQRQQRAAVRPVLPAHRAGARTRRRSSPATRSGSAASASASSSRSRPVAAGGRHLRRRSSR